MRWRASADQDAGSLDGLAVGVVAAGLDVVYPAQTSRLRQRVEEAGAVISESPLRAPALPWRFPLRNRLIAGLSDVLVVVESHRTGGSLSTVDAALLRGIPVFAVPGSIRSPASDGSNALLASGAHVLTGPDDVMMALSLAGKLSSPLNATSAAPSRVPLSGLDDFDRSVLALVERAPTPMQAILAGTGEAGADLGAVALALDRLAEIGLVRRSAGGWERLG